MDPRRTVSALLALTCFGAGLGLAAAHPAAPMLALLGFYAASVTAAWRPSLWLFAVPAGLPFLNFAPWTGWLVFDEFDLLMLAVLAAGYFRIARQPMGAPFFWRRKLSFSTLAIVVLASAGLLALLRGVQDAGGWRWGWFQGYADPLNSWRIFKSLLWASLCMPLLQQDLRRSPVQACKRLAAGMLAGLVCVTLVVLWERAAFPGWFNFTAKYRTTALFWEMHVGGAAIDAYLALSTPFVVWALRTARRPWQWAWGAVLALLVAYAGLTTFSRGVYLSMLAPLFLLGLLLWAQKAGLDPRLLVRAMWQRRRPVGWRSKAAWALSLALVAEVAGVLTGGSFMADRLADTERDFGSRVEHWQRGLDLVQNPVDLLLGKGLGRLPANYARSSPLGEWSGHVAWQPAGLQSPAHLQLFGPDTDSELDGLYAITQRVQLVPGQRYQAALQVRVQRPVDVYLQLCERHLLYPARCQDGYVQLRPSTKVWQQLSVPLRGRNFTGGPWYAPRFGVLAVSIWGAGEHVDFQSIQLRTSRGKELLANADFADGPARWFPVARSYYLPWHIDNLYLELLIERGLLGLLLTLAVLGAALWSLVLGRARQPPLAPYLAASLSGVALVGLVSSVLDVPRVAFLLFFFAFFALRLGRQSAPTAT
nr:hypothetical protein [uncultured Albidiferax sp.]